MRKHGKNPSQPPPSWFLYVPFRKPNFAGTHKQRPVLSHWRSHPIQFWKILQLSSGVHKTYQIRRFSNMLRTPGEPQLCERISDIPCGIEAPSRETLLVESEPHHCHESSHVLEIIVGLVYISAGQKRHGPPKMPGEFTPHWFISAWNGTDIWKEVMFQQTTSRFFSLREIFCLQLPAVSLPPWWVENIGESKHLPIQIINTCVGRNRML